MTTPDKNKRSVLESLSDEEFARITVPSDDSIRAELEAGRAKRLAAEAAVEHSNVDARARFR